MTTETRQLLARQIRTDGGTQPRAELNQEKVQEYADNMTRGHRFPAVDVFYDGKSHWLADGFHRHAAHMQARGGDETILCEVHQGTQRDAVLFSVGANAEHGLPRSNDDKERAVKRLLRDEEWGQWSDREIARQCKVSHPFVAKIRAALTGNGVSSEERTYTTKHGTVATMNTAAIARSNQERAEPTYASISKLESLIYGRLPYATGGRDKADWLAEMAHVKQGGKGGEGYIHLAAHIQETTAFRKGDLWQAVNNVHDQLTQQLRHREEQAAALEANAPAAQFIHQREAADRAETAKTAGALAAKIEGAAAPYEARQSTRIIAAAFVEPDPRYLKIMSIRRMLIEITAESDKHALGFLDALHWADRWLEDACTALHPEGIPSVAEGLSQEAEPV